MVKIKTISQGSDLTALRMWILFTSLFPYFVFNHENVCHFSDLFSWNPYSYYFHG